MRQVRTKISLIKTFICRNPKGKKYLTEQYESLEDELKRVRLNNLKQGYE